LSGDKLSRKLALLLCLRGNSSQRSHVNISEISTKPLRMVVDEARSQAHRLKANTYNIDVMLNVANHNRKEAFQVSMVLLRCSKYTVKTSQTPLMAYN